MGSRVLPLGFLQAGQDAVIKKFNHGRGFCRRLTEMGFVRGARVRVVKNDIGGPLIVTTGDGRLAIGRGMAMRILVEEVEQQ
jgi:ferrous iron transport protein A